LSPPPLSPPSSLSLPTLSLLSSHHCYRCRHRRHPRSKW
jgi:hypothetical protein